MNQILPYLLLSICHSYSISPFYHFSIERASCRKMEEFIKDMLSFWACL